MLTRRPLLLPLAALALTAGVASPAARGQAAQPTKVAVVDITRVYSDMQENKDTQIKFQNDVRSLQGQAQQRQAELDNLRATRDQLKPESAQWGDANQKMVQAQMEARVWQELRQLELQRQQKAQARRMFEHIEAALTDVAKQQGFDIVINSSKADITKLIEEPQVNLNTLQNILAQRYVAFASDKNDITNAVLAAVDAKYKAGGGGPPAPTAPAGK